MNQQGLGRFEDAHAAAFDDALSEIRAGDKRTHWMWFVFPQVQGLGSSEAAQRFAIRDRDEAVVFLDHPVLGANYRAAVDAVATKVVDDGVPIGLLFPDPDDLKLVSSLTLFSAVAQSFTTEGLADDRWLARAQAVLDAARAEGYERCGVTERFVARDRNGGTSSGGGEGTDDA